MSALRVLWPEEDASAVGLAVLPGCEDEVPDVVPFQQQYRIPVDMSNDIVARARSLYENRSCRSCGYPVVEPIELANGFRNRKGIVIPGTATLVGYRCRGCRAEWST